MSKYRMGMALLYGVMAILLLLPLSCRRLSCQMKFLQSPEEGWRASDTLFFPVDSILEEGTYELSVVFRTSSAKRYPFRQIVVEVTPCWGDSFYGVPDTLDCQLTEPDGEVNGRGVSIYAYDYPVDTIHLSVGDRGRICIRHLMRRTPLVGIYNVGVVLDKIDN